MADRNTSLSEINNFNLVVKKTINNRESRQPSATGKKQTESEVNIPINCIAFNQNEKFQN